MHKPSVESMSDFEKNQKEVKKIIAKAAKKSGNEILEKMSKEDRVMDDKSRLKNIELAEQVFRESIAMYREGEFKTFTDMCQDLIEALTSIETEDEDDEDENEEYENEDEEDDEDEE